MDRLEHMIAHGEVQDFAATQEHVDILTAEEIRCRKELHRLSSEFERVRGEMEYYEQRANACERTRHNVIRQIATDSFSFSERGQ